MKSTGIHSLLKLQHFRHTGMPLEHHHTSYRALFAILAVAGLTMVTISYASADDYTVNATVPGTTITNPAVITEPADATTFTNSHVTIKGTCQIVNTGTVVAIVRNGVPLGSGVCQGVGTFTIPITLLVGENAIRTKVTTGLNVNGPDGQVVLLYYAPPPQPTATANPTSGTAATPVASAASGGLFSISTGGTAVFDHQLGQEIAVIVYMYNGVAPYSLEINWGDGDAETLSISDQVSFVRLSHDYMSAGSHTVMVQVTDGAGRRASYQFVIRTNGLPPLAMPTTNIHTPQPSWGTWTLVTQVVWLSYAVLATVVTALWLVSPSHTSWIWRVPHLLAQVPAAHGRSRRSPR